MNSFLYIFVLAGCANLIIAQIIQQQSADSSAWQASAPGSNPSFGSASASSSTSISAGQQHMPLGVNGPGGNRGPSGPFGSSNRPSSIYGQQQLGNNPSFANPNSNFGSQNGIGGLQNGPGSYGHHGIRGPQGGQCCPCEHGHGQHGPINGPHYGAPAPHYQNENNPIGNDGGYGPRNQHQSPNGLGTKGGFSPSGPSGNLGIKGGQGPSGPNSFGPYGPRGNSGPNGPNSGNLGSGIKEGNSFPDANSGSNANEGIKSVKG